MMLVPNVTFVPLQLYEILLLRSGKKISFFGKSCFKYVNWTAIKSFHAFARIIVLGTP